MWKLAAYGESLKGLEDLRKMGFKYVTIHPGLLRVIGVGMLPREEEIQAVKRGLEDNDLEPVDVSIFSGWDFLGLSGRIDGYLVPLNPEYEETRRRGVQALTKLIKMCKTLGCNQLTAELGGTPVYHLDHEEAWMKSVKDLSPILREEGVRLAFLPHPGDFLEENNAVVDMIREVKCKEVGYVYCVPHTFALAGRYDADASAMIEYAADVLMGVQMADSLKPNQMWVYQHREVFRNHSHLLPGKGMIDIKGVLKTLKKIDYTGHITLIPYTLGMYPKTLADLQLEAKQTIEKMMESI